VTPAVIDPNDRLRQHLSTAIAEAGLSDAEPDLPMSSSARKRARSDPRAGSRLATVALVQEDDVLRWVYDPPPASSRRRRMRRGAAIGDAGEVIKEFQFLEVPPNEVIQRLERLDLTVTPQRGLRQWTEAGLGPLAEDALKGRILLLVHGTFSHGDMFVDELGATAEGRAFIADCRRAYDAVLTFDHPTVAISPWLNALDLRRALSGAAGPIDVICHSRGGLVVSWWLLHARPNVGRVVYVGSPLEGTSLAAPARLKAALDLVGNLARALGTVANTASTAVPMLAFAGGIMKIFGGILNLGVRSPLLDAGVAVVPGLAAQSRVGNNAELLRLFDDDWTTAYSLHAILSNYEPAQTPAPWWKFWRHFRALPGRIADVGADAIFDGPNDLVVDTVSMTRLGQGAIGKDGRLEFAGDAAVHHCAYFRQPKSVQFLEAVLKV
jgi:pimeloyl-ACP methyl ester carboxylesterase